MKKVIILLSGTMILLIVGCAGGKYLELANAGELAFSEGNYQKSLEYAEQIITDLNSRGKTVDGKVFAMAGNAAYALEQYDKSLEYLEKARQLDYAGEKMYINLADLYYRMDNLSKEIGVLETYLEKFPEGEEIGSVRERLYQTCRESMNFELADYLWPLLDDDSRSDIKNLETFLVIHEAQGNDTKCDSAAFSILKQNANHELALKWFAEKYYWKAENRYQSEMDAYNKNKTRKQYNQLVKAFKIVTADCKKSLEYFTKLYKLYPNPEYARYLGNIYARLDDEQKAKYYHDRAQ